MTSKETAGTATASRLAIGRSTLGVLTGLLALAALALVAGASNVAIAASPPETLSYQGVLRDASDAPLDGGHDMVFRFFSADVGGDEILVDEHLAAGAGAVSVSGGLFTCELGSGNVSDGSGPGVYALLSELFRDYGEVWLEVEIDTETLSPRTRVLSSAFALNAGSLNGSGNESLTWVDSSNRFEFSDRVSVGGALTVSSTPRSSSLYNVIGDGSASSGALTNTNDLFVTGDLEVDQQLHLNNVLYMDDDGPDGYQIIYFYEDGSKSGEWIRWSDVNDMFEVSDKLYTSGDLRSDGVIIGNGEIRMLEAPPDENQTIYFWDDWDPLGQSFMWNDATARFELSTDLQVAGNVGAVDVSVDGTLDINGSIALDGVLHMDEDGPDGDQSIHF